MHDVNVPHLTPNHRPRRRMEPVIGGGHEPHLMRLSPMKRNATIDVGTEARLVGAWVIVP